MTRLLAILCSLILPLACWGGVAHGAVTIDYITTLGSTSDLTTYNFGNATAAADGLLVVIPIARNAGAGPTVINSVSIGGTNGTIWEQLSGPGNGAQVAGIAGRVVTAGSHNITLVLDAGATRAAAAVYLVRGYASTTPFDTAIVFDASTIPNTQSLTLDYPSASSPAAYFAMLAANSTASWSNAAEDSDGVFEVAFSAARRSASGSGVSETVTWGIANTRMMAGAVWEPAPVTSDAFPQVIISQLTPRSSWQRFISQTPLALAQ